MTSEETILPYFVDLMVNGDCDTKESLSKLECIYNDVGEESNEYFGAVQEIFKQTAAYSLLELQKTDEKLGAWAELVYRLATDEDGDITTSVDTEKVKAEARAELDAQKKNKSGKNRANSIGVEDPKIVQEGGAGEGLRFRRPGMNATAAAALEKARINNLEGLVNLLDGPVRPTMVTKLKDCLNKFLTISAPLANGLAIGLYKLFRFGYAIYYFAFQDNNAQIASNTELMVYERLELKQFEITTEFYRLAIQAIDDNARSQNRNLTADERQGKIEMERLIKQRTEVHQEIVRNRGKSYVFQVLFRSALNIAQHFLYSFLLTSGSWIFLQAITTTLGVITGLVGPPLTAFLQQYTVFNVLGAILSPLSKGISYVLNAEIIPNPWKNPLPGQAIEISYAPSGNTSSWGSWSNTLSGLGSGISSLTSRFGLTSISTLVSTGVGFILQNLWKLLFIYPPATKFICLACFLYSIIYYSKIYFIQGQGRLLASSRWQREVRVRQEALQLNTERERKMKDQQELAERARQASEEGSLLDPISRGIFGYFGGKRKTRVLRRRKNQRKRKSSTRKH